VKSFSKESADPVAGQAARIGDSVLRNGLRNLYSMNIKVLLLKKSSELALKI
jgi:hypothetical protein